MCYTIIKGGDYMPISRAKRQANNKWDSENMKIVACKVKKEDAQAFKDYAEEHKTTPNALLRKYIYKCIDKPEDSE